MKIGIVQLDGKLPNIALMQIASHHRSLGDNVSWWDGPLFPYDKVYASKIFKFTEDTLPDYVLRGGTGYAWDSKLPEGMNKASYGASWFLYPNYPNHLGFSERGCRLSCSFCVVPQKEGKPRKVADISDLLTNPNGEDRLVLLDDDFLGHPDCLDVMGELADRNLKVCFSQGLNIRTITSNQALMLSKINYRNLSFKSKQITFAWDNLKDEKLVKRGVQKCLEAGIKAYQMQFFVLIGYESTLDEDLHRVEWLKKIGADPFVMSYDRTNAYQRRFQRWVNHRAIFNSVSWENYQ